MIESLAYLGFTSPRADEWRTFGPDVLGAQLADDGPDGEVRLRVDEAAWRLAVCAGETDDLAYIGWQVAGPDGLAVAVDRLTAAGVAVHAGDGELAAARSVEDLAWFTDPFGFRHELVYGQAVSPEAFTAGRPMGGGFVTGEGGMGHIVLIVPDLDAASDFYLGTLGFSHSDDIDMGLQVRFAHCNRRHHTLAFSAVPGMVGVHHLMLEVANPDDVGRAYDIVQERGLPVPMGLGRHTNDHMFSFYVRTPSGFEVEYGSGGRLIDTNQPWQPEHFDAMSTWGHRPPGELLFPAILRSVETPA